MINTLNSLLKGVDLISRVPFDVPVQTICNDSRRIWPGSAFIAIPGLVNDGRDFIPDAIHRGAAVIISKENGKITQKTSNLTPPVITVKHPRRALSRIAANYYEHPSKNMTVIGITGTNGKTTTCHLIHSIFQNYGIKTGLIGTLGIKGPNIKAKTPLTTPDSIDLQRMLRLFVDGGITHVVMEVSSHALSLNRVVDVDFDFAVFTNLSQDHLDFHHTMDNYFKAKTKLFSMLQKSGTAIINAGDEKFDTLKRCTKAPVVSYRLDEGADVGFKTWGMSKDGITGIVRMGDQTININTSLVGIHNLENILAAITVAWSLGIPKDAIERGIEQCRSVPGRVEQFRTKNGATVFIDYAHTPEAYHKLFSSLKLLLPENGRLLLIFGCGGDRDREKRPLMAAAAETYCDKIFVTPDNPRTEAIEKINADIKSGFTKRNHTFYSDRGKAIRDAISELKPNDILVVVGKGRENYQIIGTEKIYFSDVEMIQRAINEIS